MESRRELEGKHRHISGGSMGPGWGQGRLTGKAREARHVTGRQEAGAACQWTKAREKALKS